MATLNKILVHVPSNLCDVFKTKYVTATTNRDTSYDNKVVFLEKTQEIFTKGKLYGTNIRDFNDLKALVGTIPSGATSTNIIDYINEKINGADHIHSVSKKSGETLIDVATSNKAVTVNSTSALTTAVSNANSAVQSVSVLGKTLNKTTNSITVAEAKTALGLGTAAYENKSAFDAAGAASTAAAGVEAKLPVVTNGSGITVTPTTDGNGKTTYKVSTSAEVFHYKGNKTALSELPSTGNTTGDVWSVGPADAVGSTLYAWDGDEWINIGGANGITGVDTTSSKGVALAKNANGTVKVNVTPGSVASGNDSVVTGGAVYTAIAAAEGRCDAKGTAQGLINALGGSATSSNGNYVNVTVNTSKGQVSGVTVSETNALENAVSNANSALQHVKVLGKILMKSDDELYNGITVEEAKTALNLGTAASFDSSYFVFADDIEYTASYSSKFINSYITTKNGKVIRVKIVETYHLDNAYNTAYNAMFQANSAHELASSSYDFAYNAYQKANNIEHYRNGDNYLEFTPSSMTQGVTYILLNQDNVFNYVSDNIWENYTA